MASELLDYLDCYRAQENNLAVSLLVEDSTARRILVAWTLYARIPAWVRPEGELPPDDERKRWEWLWQPVMDALDMDDLSAVCGMAAFGLQRKLRQLVSARLMYPDGTITKAAEAVIRAKTSQSLPKKKADPK